MTRSRVSAVEVSGADLRVGDTIEVWWADNRDTLTALRPYIGPLACLKGARVADFALLKTGMTIEPGSRHRVLNRSPRPRVHDLCDPAFPAWDLT